jgi:hypothetical protein
MERLQWVHQRFEAWALWLSTGSGYGGGFMFDPNRVDQTADVRMGLRNTDPLFDSSALETDMAIAQLPPDLKRAVIAAYRWEGSMQGIAQKLGCTRATLHTRLCNADRRVRDWLDAKKQRAAELKQRGFFATYT